MQLANTVLPCCISHEFFRSASENLHRTAVVHATGGIRVCRELRHILSRSDGAVEAEKLFASYRESSWPPVYRGDVCYTYGDLLRAVETLSVRLRRVLDGGDDPDVIRPKCFKIGQKSWTVHKFGFRFPEIVGICIGPSVEYIVCVLAVLRCGEAFFPLDPLWPEDRIKFLVESSNTAIVVVCDPASFSIGRFEGMKVDRPSDKNGYSILQLSMDKCLQEEPPCNALLWPCKDKNPRLFCYLMYTSGSTGKPKGVCGTEKGLLNRYIWMQDLFPLRNSDIMLFKTSSLFIDHIQEFLAAVLTCTALVVPPFHELRTNPSYMVYTLKVYQISRLTTVPSLSRAVLPSFESLISAGIHILSLNLLILSGETLSIPLWRSLSKLLPDTTILNLYGSTEVSGDCMYFDCNNLSKILEVETLITVPIGVPIHNCDIIVHNEHQHPEGELCVGGSCLFAGYLDDLYLQLSTDIYSSQLLFRTGDFARCLPTGDYVFIGRRDRTLKVNGQRVALEEIEAIIREHPAVVDVAVVHRKGSNDTFSLDSYIVFKDEEHIPKDCAVSIDANRTREELILDLRKFLLSKLPLVMIPSKFISIKAFPLTSSGKVDYAILESSLLTDYTGAGSDESSIHCHDHLQIIKEAFCNALVVEEVSESDDFFALGGNSMSAAQVAHTLGIDMRLLYLFPSPINLLSAVNSKSSSGITSPSKIFDRKRRMSDVPTGDNENQKAFHVLEDDSHHHGTKACKKDTYLSDSKMLSRNGAGLWNGDFPSYLNYSFSRCNYLKCRPLCNTHDALSAHIIDISGIGSGFLQEIWKVPLFSCVDASPLLLLREGHFQLFIGSHSHIFLCLDATSGEVKWKVKLDGRIECSAAMTDDFRQVVVGCYQGRIYFINSMSGMTSWVFQTDGEVKMQPVACNGLIWCGSHDHNLYALDYQKQICVYRISCGGSLYGSPSIDTVRKMLYAASTSGRVTALHIEAPEFCMAWLREMGVPIFGSPCLNPSNGNVICCFVDGSVFALDTHGSTIWKATTGGPIFAGACISSLLPSQVLVCSRNGTVYSFELERGGLMWEYNTGSPITASAYIDEQIDLSSDPSRLSDRLACICSSDGRIHVLRINSGPSKPGSRVEDGSSGDSSVELFASMDLPGDIFSSPVMIGGRIFVGCRDDHLHCLSVAW